MLEKLRHLKYKKFNLIQVDKKKTLCFTRRIEYWALLFAYKQKVCNIPIQKKVKSI